MPPDAVRMLMAAVALTLAGCGEANSPGPASSVTVKLPPPRPAEARPGFSGLLDETAPGAAVAEQSDS